MYEPIIGLLVALLLGAYLVYSLTADARLPLWLANTAGPWIARGIP